MLRDIPLVVSIIALIVALVRRNPVKRRKARRALLAMRGEVLR